MAVRSQAQCDRLESDCQSRYNKRIALEMENMFVIVGRGAFCVRAHSERPGEQTNERTSKGASSFEQVFDLGVTCELDLRRMSLVPRRRDYSKKKDGAREIAFFATSAS